MRKIHKISLTVFSLTLGLVALGSFHRQGNLIPLLSEDETSIIHLGDRVTVTERKLSYNDETIDVQGKIITPSGGTYSGREFTAKEHGRYQVVYEAYFGHHLETRYVNYICQRRSTDYFSVNDSASLSYGEFRYNNSKYFHQGVIVDVKNGAEITFNEPLDMVDFMVPQHIERDKTYLDPSTGADAKSLIDFIVDPTEQMTYDFTGITIKLTDTENPDNYVEIRAKESGFTNYTAGALCYTKAGFSGGFLGGWEYNWQTGVPGDGKFGISGTGLAMSFKGQPYQDILHSGQILCDYANKRFYTYPGSLSHNQVFFINDFDEPNFYKDKGWGGFTNGKCYVSIKPFNFTNSTGRILIKAIGKFSFLNEEMPDETKPVVNVDYQGYSKTNVPKAVVGQYYPVFKASVFDNFDADLPVNVNVTYKDEVNNKFIDVSYKDNKFLASKAGTYYINYSATDRSGNVSDKVSVRVDTIDDVSDIVLTLPQNEMNQYVLDEVAIPKADDITASGGSGRIDISYEILDPQNQVVKPEGYLLKLEKIGDYKVIYTGTDYIGRTGSKTLTIHSLTLEQPKFVSNINLPKAFIKGFTYHLTPVLCAEVVNNEIVYVDSHMLVNGEPYVEEFIANGDSMTIKYVAGETVETVVVPVIDVSDPINVIDQSKYFFGDVNATMNQDDVTLSTNSDASTTFIHELDSSNFVIDLKTIEGFTNFEEVVFKFIDFDNLETTATIRLNLNTKKVSIPGTDDINFATSIAGDQFSLGYNDVNKKLFDTMNNDIAVLSIDDLGLPLKGFNHGFYLEIGFAGVTSFSKIQVIKLNNQSLGYKEGSGDEGKPTIRLSGPFIATQTYGENFYYPYFEAYDVLSEIEDTLILVSKPNGQTIRGDNTLQDTFVIDEFGRYRVNYQASDTAGNIAKINNTVFVYDDVPPTLSVGDLVKSEYAVGDVVSLPSYQVSDNLNKYYLDIMLILPTNEMRILIHDDNGAITYALTDSSLYNRTFIVDNNSFRTEMTGRHKLRYVAYDDEFNTTVIELTFYVK